MMGSANYSYSSVDDDELRYYLIHITKTYGMQKILEQLIASLDTDEDYILTLREDLQNTYDNYMLRYNLFRFGGDKDEPR